MSRATFFRSYFCKYISPVYSVLRHRSFVVKFIIKTTTNRNVFLIFVISWQQTVMYSIVRTEATT